MVWVHVYAAAYELQGESEWVDEEELNRDPDSVEQRLFDNFVDWLKGKPDLMRINGGLELQAGKGSSFAPSPRNVLQLAQERRQEHKHGVVERTRGFVVMVTRRGQVVVRNAKSGRFASRSSFLEA